MTILYIFPHPDDESFGPARAMSQQLRNGHAVHLLTLTRGGATRRRHELGLSVEEMGEVRYQEMLNVEKVLGLTGMTVLDLPDSGLKEMDPRDIESAILPEILRITPDVIVTYAVHGISGFHDHLVSHAVVKRLWVGMPPETRPGRLAFFTLTEEEAKKPGGHFQLSFSRPDEIDCVITVDQEDIARNIQALDCYVSYQETIRKSGVIESLGTTVSFEIFGEKHNPPLQDITQGVSPIALRSP